MVKKGDTLIEVTIAIGIFSMVAIAVVSVMSSGSSNAQTALETTLAREEIDAQAEAIRFIHAAHLAENDPNGVYSKLWKSIKSRAIKYDKYENDINNFNPKTCEELYQPELDNNYFIIDPRSLDYRTAIADRFTSPSTYPRIIYNDNDTIQSVEGLYVIAVKPNGDTIASAYYDFYIRACWYGAGSKAPSTISTVIRLYDPKGLK